MLQLHVTLFEYQQILYIRDRATRTIGERINEAVWISGMRSLLSAAIIDRMIQDGTTVLVIHRNTAAIAEHDRLTEV